MKKNKLKEAPIKNSKARDGGFVPAASVLNILEGKLGWLNPTALSARTLKV